MVKVQIVALLLLFSSHYATAQSEIPFKGANTIIVHTSLPNDSSYLKLGQTLVEKGYSIDVNNRDFFQLKTGIRSVADYLDLRYQLVISVIKGSLVIKADIHTNSIVGTYPWSYSKSKMTKDHVVYQEILKNLGHLGSISYEKRE